MAKRRSSTSANSTRSDVLAYTFGYWGWGRQTKRLIELADDWEHSQGRKPPLWVDIRWSRSVRALGFRDDAFERTAGPDRYLWLRGLGNSAVTEGGMMKIADRKQAEVLLDAILEANDRGRRVIFFCACELVRVEGRCNCHRDRVASLLLAAARRRRRRLTIIEWPGGEPQHLQFEVADKRIRSWKTFVLPRAVLPRSAPLLVPQGTALYLHGKESDVTLFLQTPTYSGGWRHRILRYYQQPMTPKQVEREQRSIQRWYGLRPRSTWAPRSSP